MFYFTVLTVLPDYITLPCLRFWHSTRLSCLTVLHNCWSVLPDSPTWLSYLTVLPDSPTWLFFPGATLSTLWTRLEQRKGFQLAIDDKSKLYLWKSFAGHVDLQFYEMQDPRPPLVYVNRFDFIDPDTGFWIDTVSHAGSVFGTDLHCIYRGKSLETYFPCLPYYLRQWIW